MKSNIGTALFVAAGFFGLEILAQAQPITNQTASASAPTNESVPIPLFIPVLTTNPAPTSPSGTALGTKANLPFYKRLDQALREQLGMPAYTPPALPVPGAPPPAVTRRGNPAPFDSPPYPDGEWQLGGSEIIGDMNLTPDYPLMQAIYQGPHGQAVANTGVKLYGWEDVSGNVSTSGQQGVNPRTGSGANFPEAYDSRPNRLEQNQFVLYLERTADEFQTDHLDWGFRLSWVYGLDYRYMISRGFFSDQLLVENRFYGFDCPMMYGTIYIPRIFDGENIMIGRTISMADIEAQLAPNNLMSSHSLLYAFDPYCQWGIFSTTKINRNWIFQAGLSCGNDLAIWETRDAGYQPTAAVMVQYQSDNNKFSFYGGGNAINNAEWGFNNLQQYVGTFTYKLNDTIWTSHETWYMYQHDAKTGPTPSVPYTDGEFPNKPGYAPEWATLNYTMFRLGPGTFFTVRNELFDDIVGQRTGYTTLYSEHSIGLAWWPSQLITIRPELRFEHAYQAYAYDNGTRKSQFTAQCDIVFHF